MLQEKKCLVSAIRGEAVHWPGGYDSGFADNFWNIALQNGVASLCYSQLYRKPQWKFLPVKLQNRLHHHVLNAVALEILWKHDLSRFLEVCGSEYPVLLIKGTHLAYSHYPAPYIRTRCDTDMLFPDRVCAENAGCILHKLGYERRMGIIGDLISHEFSYDKRGPHGVTFTLDLHHKINNYHFFADIFSFHDLAGRAVVLDDLSPYARTPCPVDALIIACIHRLAHGPDGISDRLIWLYDIHLLASRLTANEWDDLLAMCRTRNICGICLDGLKMAQNIFLTRMPTRAMRILRKYTQGDKISIRITRSKVMMDLANLGYLHGIRKRCRFVKEHLFPAPAYIFAKYKTDHILLLPYLYIRRLIAGIIKMFIR